VLDIGAERARYLRQRATGIAELAEARFDFVAALLRMPMGPGVDTVASVADAPRQRAQALAAGVRIPADSARGTRTDALSQARYALARWHALLDAGRAPADWRAWLVDFEAMERMVHGATRGMVDQAFYGRVAGFLERTQAPRPVHDAVEFRRALGAWDFTAARDAGGRLAADAVEGRGLVPPRDLLEGVVTAHLALGEPRAADSLFRLLLPRVAVPQGDLRMFLLVSYLDAGARAAGGVTPSGRPPTP
jgi:hypothetical protein